MKRKLMMYLTVILIIVMVMSFGSVALAAGYQYFDGTVQYEYYTTPDKDLYKASTDRTFTDNLYIHVFTGTTTGAAYTSRLYQSGSTTAQVSEMVDKPANQIGSLSAVANTYQGNVRFKIHNAQNYGTQITYYGKWYIS